MHSCFRCLAAREVSRNCFSIETSNRQYHAVMKGKKSVFEHSSTGLGKSRGKIHTGRASNKTNNKTEPKEKETPKLAEINTVEDDKDLNSGFGEYMRTPEAVEMMKLFVFANSIMLILTMAWPNLKEHYYMLMQWYNSFQES